MSELEARFKTTLKSMRPPTIAALVSYAEDQSTMLPLFEHPRIMEALETRGILRWNWTEWDWWFQVGMSDRVQLIVFTEFGKAFVAWMRQPKNVSGDIPAWEYPEQPDLPTQLSMFDDGGDQ